MNNTIFIMTNTKFKKKINSKLYQNIKISLAKYQSKNRKRTYIEFYGETKAKQIKEKLSLSHKGKVSNMKGKNILKLLKQK